MTPARTRVLRLPREIEGLSVVLPDTGVDLRFLQPWLTIESRLLGATERSTRIVFRQGDERGVKVAEGKYELIVTAPDYERLTSQNRLSLLLNIWRFIGFHTPEVSWHILHASAATIYDKTVLFCDDDGYLGFDVRSIKTSPVLAVAGERGRYVGDELLLFSPKEGRVADVPGVPIRLRPEAKALCVEKGLLKADDERILFSPEDLNLGTSTGARVGVVVYLHMGDRLRVDRLSPMEALRRAEVTCKAHFAKLLFPQYDRVRFDTDEDRASGQGIYQCDMSQEDFHADVVRASRGLAQIPAWHVEIDQLSNLLHTLAPIV